MPTTYTHDLFGKEVFKKLPDNLKDVIRKSKSLYLIGLHGPDIFFYYKPFGKNKVNRTAMEVHEKIAASVFQRGIKKVQERPSDKMMSYLLGFACHYILDSACHPYIWEYQRITGVSHAEIETELDRMFMEQEHKNPFTYHPAVSICPTRKGNEIISSLFPSIRPEEVWDSLKGMKFYTGILVCKTECKRKLLLLLLKVLGCYDSMEGQVMRKHKNPQCEASNEELVVMYQKAVDEAVEALGNLYECMMGREELSERFYRNFE